MNNETINIKKENVMVAYSVASDEIKDMLEILFGEAIFNPKDVTERIKTFEDACNELGREHPLVEEYGTIISRCGGLSADILAYMKLRIITAALNEGWEPQFTADEWRYFPWFVLCTQKEIDEMDEEQKNRVVSQSHNVANVGGGVACAFTYSNSSGADAIVGFRLAFKSSELAEYAGKQFIEIWADYVFKAE